MLLVLNLRFVICIRVSFEAECDNISETTEGKETKTETDMYMHTCI